MTDTIQPMAHLRCDFFSETLALSTSMTVILPQATSTQIGMTGQAGTEPPPVLYLLHGLSDDHTIWLRRTSIERYVAPLGLAVVMPQVHRSFYVDEVYGGRYWTFLSEELPAVVASFFRVSTRPEDTFVAGLSMGGYGALRWALKQPMRLGAAVSLSGAVNVAGLRTGRVRAEDPRLFDRVFGSGGGGGQRARPVRPAGPHARGRAAAAVPVLRDRRSALPRQPGLRNCLCPSRCAADHSIHTR